MARRYRRLEELEVQGQRVFVRVDFNVPFDEQGRITEDTRIRAAVPTLQRLLDGGARVILASHLGRPKGKVVETLRMAPVAARLSELLGRPVNSAAVCRGAEASEAVASLSSGEVLLLENVRFEAGETKGDESLAQDWLAFSDRFVNDAFGTSHRAHSSVVGVAQGLAAEHRAAGLLMERELAAFERVSNPDRPFVAILGGAKVSDKILVVERLLEKVDRLLIGGGMAYTFLKSQGHAIGQSKVEDEQLDVASKALAKAKELGTELLLPVDHVTAPEFSATATATTVDSVEIPDGQMALDIGPKTTARYCEAIADARTVVWNGPLGVFEWEAFDSGSGGVAKAIAECSGHTVVGGGDSLAVIKKFALEGRFDHVSTGGGAFLELLEGKALPGVEVLYDAS